MEKETREIIESKLVKGLKMSDGSEIEGYVVGSAPFIYIIPREDVDSVRFTGQQQIKIEAVAERVLAHT